MESIKEELKMVKTAHSRLLNQHKELEKVVLNLLQDQKELNKYVQEQLIELNNTQPPKVKSQFVIGNRYREKIIEIISSKQVEWQGSQYVSYVIKLNEREEIYTAFISLKYNLLPGFMIDFTYEGEGKLRSIKIMQ
jgi:DNA mismatch repair ATPase MutS